MTTSPQDVLLTTIGLLANSVVLGAPIWVFFLQSPVLLGFMGRPKFLPPMMRLTRLLFRWTLPVAAAMVVATELMKSNSKNPTSWSTLLAALSLGAILVNSMVIVPKALQAGMKAALKKDDDDNNNNNNNNNKPKKSSSQVADMAVSGGDPSSGSVTKTLHQTVVVFVVIMVIGSVGYVYTTVLDLSSSSV